MTGGEDSNCGIAVVESRDAERMHRLGLRWGALALAVLLLAPAAPWLAGLLWACPFKTLTGWPCPSCGLTRSALALAALDPLGALTRYPLQALAWLGFLGGGLASGLAALLGRPLHLLPLGEIPTWSKILLLLAVLTNWAWGIHLGI